MLLAGGFAPEHPEHALADPPMADVAAAIDGILTAHLPFPALVVDPGWDLVSANDAVYALLDGVAPRLLEPPVNVIRLTLDSDGLAPADRQPRRVARAPARAAAPHEHDATGDPRLAVAAGRPGAGRPGHGRPVTWASSYRCGCAPRTAGTCRSCPPPRCSVRRARSRSPSPRHRGLLPADAATRAALLVPGVAAGRGASGRGRPGGRNCSRCAGGRRVGPPPRPQLQPLCRRARRPVQPPQLRPLGGHRAAPLLNKQTVGSVL